MRGVSISTSDNRMDCHFSFHDPLNALPAKCAACGFPDLDYVPQPYVLVKSRTANPNELAGAENGNFFVRDRVRRVLDLVAPGLCTYYPTCFKGTTDPTPWLLAVPQQQVATAIVDPKIPRCTKCQEPRSAHPGTQWKEHLLQAYPRPDGWSCELTHDLVKSATWGSSEKSWNLWISRDLYLSVRLLGLLKKIKARGFYESTCQKQTVPDKEETAWIKDKLRQIEAAGIAQHAAGTISDEDAKWLREFLKTHAKSKKSEFDQKAIEKRVKAKLPNSYVDFITAVGTTSFDDVDEQQGWGVTILPPTKLEYETGYAEFEDEDSQAVHALRFATAVNGDCFCFDVQKGKKEFSIVLYNHEGNFFEPYAENFAACLKRFAGGAGE
jgi:hypothetical protein